MERRRPMICAYFAISVDGLIADEGGGVSWLTPFEQVDVGFDDFLASITTIAMGRRTYDQVRTFGEWPYAGKDVIVVTSQELRGAPPGVRAFSGPPSALARQLSGGDMWVLGGAALFNSMLWAGLIEKLQLFVVPGMLGRGVPLFAGTPEAEVIGRQIDLRFRRAETHPLGMVELVYEVVAQQ
ncbi:MAG: dihydrofolate reductase [Rhizobiales bacterium]|nr:dihydrofolate reductase [Hyphomicrobiales bacterium]